MDAEAQIEGFIAKFTEDVAREAMRRAIHKLPMKCKFVSREGGEF